MLSEPTRRAVLKTLAAGAAAANLDAAATVPPNIVVILADDMGFSDIGCYGSEISTPNIDRLASGGVRFTQFYNCARCCPSRASLLTGLHPHKAGVGHMVDRTGPEPGYANDLSHNVSTIAEALRPAGYRTMMSGKWHVTPITESKANWPMQRGFDDFYGLIAGAADYFNPATLTDRNEPIEATDPDFYLTDALGDRAAQFIGKAAESKKPYFLYASFTGPHWPLHAHPADIAKYRGRYKDGWDALRIERHEKQLRMGLLEKRWDMSPRDPDVPAWKDTTDREWQETRMEVYAAMVETLDRNIGKILDKIKATGQEDRTLVMFMSDNGGCAEELGPSQRPIYIRKATRRGLPVRPGNISGVTPGSEETFQSYGLNWANASNTPFRLYKHWVHEGGISTPLIIRWPARIKPSKRFIAEPGHFVDIMPTCLDAAGIAPASAPKDLAGRSLLPPATGKPARPERSLYWEHEGNRAIRRGDWKLVRKFPGSDELYNIREDRTELHNRAADMQEKVRELSADWEAWAKQNNVLPWEYIQEHSAPRA